MTCQWSWHWTASHMTIWLTFPLSCPFSCTHPHLIVHEMTESGVSGLRLTDPVLVCCCWTSKNFKRSFYIPSWHGCSRRPSTDHLPVCYQQLGFIHAPILEPEMPLGDVKWTGRGGYLCCDGNEVCLLCDFLNGRCAMKDSARQFSHHQIQ